MASVNLLDENLLLWSKFRNGNANAFGELMRTHYQDLFNYGTRFTKDQGLVKDCIQELFLALWVHRLSISETSFVKYYLLKSLRHSLTRAINRSRRTGPSFEYLFNSAQPRKTRKVLAGLSHRQQEIIYLRFYLDADNEEIAEIMSLSRQLVCKLLHDALRRLRKISPKKTSWFPHLLPLLF
ncbi:MAG TPA: sigma-70 family RNA polymerase sigma factor [Puia sp.]|jgi:DNA-directed RNA polymerase specialized sigma24 family protein|nr:sigma-70 family RNA polymerase sigma factor [Puia sp.]